MNDVHQIVRNTYNHIAEKYYQRYHKYSPFFLKFSKIFLKLLPERATILDLGCGPGRDAKYFSLEGYEVIGVDFSGNMLKIARKIAPNANFLKQDLRKINFPANSFYGIWCSFTILHLERDELPRLLKLLEKVLKKNGILFIATKLGEGEQILKENLDTSLAIFETYFSKKEIETLLKGVGFKLLLTDSGFYDRFESDDNILVVLAQKS